LDTNRTVLKLELTIEGLTIKCKSKFKSSLKPDKKSSSTGTKKIPMVIVQSSFKSDKIIQYVFLLYLITIMNCSVAIKYYFSSIGMSRWDFLGIYCFWLF